MQLWRLPCGRKALPQLVSHSAYAHLWCRRQRRRSSSPASPSLEIRAARTTMPTHVDGLLDEPSLGLTRVITGFTQSDPEQGQSATHWPPWTADDPQPLARRSRRARRTAEDLTVAPMIRRRSREGRRSMLYVNPGRYRVLTGSGAIRPRTKGTILALRQSCARARNPVVQRRGPV